jgi:hypothetical protein
MHEAMEPARGISAVANAAAGRWEPALNFMGRQYNRITGGLTPAVANETLRIGMSRDPRVMQGIYDRALRQAAEVPAHRARLAQQLMAAEAAAMNNR